MKDIGVILNGCCATSQQKSDPTWKRKAAAVYIPNLGLPDEKV